VVQAAKNLVMDLQDADCRDLIAQSGLPPVRLHGLRHGAATVLLAARVDLKIVQEILRHTMLSTTADLYTSVVAELTRDALAAGAATITQHRSNSRAGTNRQDQPTPTGTDREGLG
jgi:site-specific recombinase XerD